MAKPCIDIRIRTRAETSDWAYGKQFLQSLYRWGDLLVPDRMSHNPDNFSNEEAEPFTGVDEAEKKWALDISRSYDGVFLKLHQWFAWRRRKNLKYLGWITHKQMNVKGDLLPGSIKFTSGYSEKVDWLSLFREWCEIFPLQLGLLHYYKETKPHFIPPNAKFEEPDIRFNALINPDIDDAGWAMYYGDEFAEKVDAAKISAADFPIEKIGNGYLVRITENIEDVNDFAAFTKRREEHRKLFPKGFFVVDRPLP